MNPRTRSRAAKAASPANGRVRMVVFVLGACALVAAFAALVRSHQFHSPLGIAALLAIELSAIALAVGFHLIELPGAAPRGAGEARPLRMDIDYL